MVGISLSLSSGKRLGQVWFKPDDWGSLNVFAGVCLAGLSYLIP